VAGYPSGDRPQNLVVQREERIIQPAMRFEEYLQGAVQLHPTGAHLDLVQPILGRIDSIARDIRQHASVEALNRTHAVLVRDVLKNPAERLIALFARTPEPLFCDGRIAPAVLIGGIDRVVVLGLQRRRVGGLDGFLRDGAHGLREPR
jgi:hypothetical protein